jgi:hypothetical protein
MTSSACLHKNVFCDPNHIIPASRRLEACVSFNSWPFGPSHLSEAALSPFKTKYFSGASDMRRPLNTELSAEDRSLKRRWVMAVTSFYSVVILVIVAAALISSTADKTTVVASAEPQRLLQDRSGTPSHGPLPYGSLPNAVAASGAH